MFLNTCPFCEHGNPTDSKFCNACGGALHLLPCPRCGAVNDVTAAACYQCHGHLPGRGTDALDSAEPIADVSKPPPRPHSRIIVGAAVLATIAILAYYSYGQRWLAGTSQLPVANSGANGRGSPAEAGIVVRDAAARVTATVKVDDNTGAVRPATAARETPLPGATPAAANRPRVDREPSKSRESKAVATPIARAKANDVGSAGERGRLRPEACTEAVAALGLCTFKPAERKEAEKAATNKAEIARPQSAAVGKAGGQDLRQGETCTTAVAALGLCTPKLTREGK